MMIAIPGLTTVVLSSDAESRVATCASFRDPYLLATSDAAYFPVLILLLLIQLLPEITSDTTNTSNNNVSTSTRIITVFPSMAA